VSDREKLLDEIGALEFRVLTGGLPEETVSLLDYDLTLQQLRAFALVFTRGQTPINKLAESLGIKPNVASGIIQRLVDRGLIGRTEDAADRRVRLLTLTERGHALVEQLKELLFKKGRTVLERLTDEQLRQLRDILATLGQTVPER
jgi:DNA-binding MarR family transcriptional regulator